MTIDTSYISLYQNPRDSYYYTTLGDRVYVTYTGFKDQNDVTNPIIVCGQEESTCTDDIKNTVFTLQGCWQDPGLGKFRVFVPPGTNYISILSHVPQNTRYIAVARLGKSPDDPYLSTGVPTLKGYTLSQLRDADCVSLNVGGYLYIATDTDCVVQSEDEGGWLYFTIRVEIGDNNTDIVVGHSINVGDEDTHGTYLHWFLNHALWGDDGDPIDGLIDENNPHDQYTKLMLHFDSVDPDGNFIDDSLSHLIPVNYNSSILDLSTLKFGEGSLNVGEDESTASGLYFENIESIFDFLDQDFTIESWIFTKSISESQKPIIIYQDIEEQKYSFGLYQYADYLIFAYSDNSIDGTVYTVSFGSGIEINSWNHISVNRFEDKLYCSLNGSMTEFDILTTTLGSQLPKLYIGMSPEYSYGFYGNLDELRISKGIARQVQDFTPAKYPYGSIPTALYTKDLLIQNIDSVEHDITATYPDGFSGDWSGGIIEPGSEQLITITFAPTEERAYSGNIVFQCTEETITCAVFGSTNKAGILLVEPGVLNFGFVTTNQSSSKTLELTNSTPNTLTVSVTCPLGFTSNQTSFSIATNQKVSLTITFHPTSSNQYSGQVVIYSGDFVSRITVSGNLPITYIGKNEVYYKDNKTLFYDRLSVQWIKEYVLAGLTRVTRQYAEVAVFHQNVPVNVTRQYAEIGAYKQNPSMSVTSQYAEVGVLKTSPNINLTRQYIEVAYLNTVILSDEDPFIFIF